MHPNTIIIFLDSKLFTHDIYLGVVHLGLIVTEVPQGTVLGPLLFISWITHLGLNH